MRTADVDALAACAAAADRGADASEGAAAEATPEPDKAKRAVPTRISKSREKYLRKKEKKRAAKQAARAAAAEAELPPCREIATPPEVLAALEASDRAATPEPTVPADPSLFKPCEPTGPAEPSPSRPGGAPSWGRGFLAIGTTAKKEASKPDLRDPYAYIASTIDEDDDLTAPALHDAPSPPVADLDGLVIEEVTAEELARLELVESAR